MTLYDMATDDTISERFIIETGQNVTKVENTALDGTYYMQIIGSPAVYYNITAFMTAAGKAFMETAEANGDILCAETNADTYYGRITSQSAEWLGGDLYKASVVLAKEADL